MRLIDTEEGAKRLARVILSDIEIYNRQKVWSRADLKPQLDEGYALFRSRVVPALVPLFSDIVADRWSDPSAGPAAGARGPTPSTATAAAPPVAPRSVAMPASPRGPLDPKEAARRLARVMASSIRGCDRPDGGAGLAADIREARTLFQSCVLPEQAPLFEDALAELGLLEQQPLPVGRAPAPAPPMLVSPYESTQMVPTPPDPDEDLPTIAVPAASSRKLPPFVERSPATAWLAAAAVAVATAAASIVYLILTG